MDSMHRAVFTFQPLTRPSTVPASSSFITCQIDFCCHFLKFLLLGHHPHLPNKGSRLREEQGSHRLWSPPLSCQLACTTLACPLPVLSALWQTGFQRWVKTKLVSRQWRHSRSQTGSSYWNKSSGYAEPSEVRTNPATVRVESSSTTG